MVHQFKKHKPWFDKGSSKLSHERKQEKKMQWLQDPSEINGDNLNNVRREATIYFRNKKREYLQNKVIKKCISHPTRAQHTTSATETVPSFSCAISSSLLMLTAGQRDQFPRWRRSRRLSVLRFEVSRSVITVQHEFRARFRNEAPHKNNVTRWYRQFADTWCRSTGRPRVSDDNIERVRQEFQRSPCKSVARASDTFHTVIFGMLNSLLARRQLGTWFLGPAVSKSSELLIAHEKLWQFLLVTVNSCALVRWVLNSLLTFETATFFCVCPAYTSIYIYIYIVYAELQIYYVIIQSDYKRNDWNQTCIA
jgi:hypothetical protein